MNVKRLLPILPVLALGCGGTESPTPGDELNVLFLNVELLRADFVGLLNPESDATPNIDRFFRDAVIFEDVSAPAGETAGSSCAVLSALEGLHFPIDLAEARELGYVTALKMQKLRHADEIVSIAETLSEAGFVTININQGRRSGRHVGFDAGFRQYVELHHRTLIEEPLAALEEELRACQGRRFFALFHPNTLHADPYRYPLDRERIEASSIRYNREGEGYDVLLAADGLDEEERRELARAVYRQQLRYVDEKLERIFELLEESYLENTIIVLYSNHGEGLYDNGVEFHGVSYQSCIHVPLLIRHPRIDRRIRIETPVSLIDLAPTVCEWVGVEPAPSASDTSLVPLIEGGEYGRKFLLGKGLLDTYVREGDWKLISGQGDELYHLGHDPHEEQNLIGEHRELADRLTVILMVRLRDAAEFGAREGGE